MIQATVNTIISSIMAIAFYFTLIGFLKKFLFEFRIHNLLSKQEQYIIPSFDGLDCFEKEILKLLIQNCPTPIHENVLKAKFEYSIDSYNKAITKLLDCGSIEKDGDYFSLKKR